LLGGTARQHRSDNLWPKSTSEIRKAPMSAVLQFVSFLPKPDVSADDFAAMNERFQREIAPHLPDLERREAAVDEDGRWTLVLRYSSMDAATRPPADHGMEVAGAFMAMIDMSTMSVSFSTIVSE
jgi:hypothetical protein